MSLEAALITVCSTLGGTVVGLLLYIWFRYSNKVDISDETIDGVLSDIRIIKDAIVELKERTKENAANIKSNTDMVYANDKRHVDSNHDMRNLLSGKYIQREEVMAMVQGLKLEMRDGFRDSLVQFRQMLTDMGVVGRRTGD